ncbi:MAG: esterase/lipase family protein [Solirubrobacterales bacterium]
MSKKAVSWLLVMMIALSVCVLPAAPASAEVVRQNTYPIILVHGFMGFGRDEALGFKYWGGFGDIQEDLKAQGYPCFTASVGPVSSSWDRACELYAQITGGTADYGKVHAAKYGHARYGRTYPAFVPNWGQTDANGKINKVHLIGHSLGGQTTRLLVQLLEEGDTDEVAGTPAEELSPLFTGGKSYVSSVTVVCSGNDGTTMATAVMKLVPAAQQLFALLAGMMGVTGQNLYDFKLDQWGLKRNVGESITSYSNRVFSSGLWSNTKDISAWDQQPEGAREMNGWVKAQPDVFYFSQAAEETWKGLITGNEIPEIGMDPMLSATAIFIGSFKQDGSGGRVPIDSTWLKNDGVINTNSEDGPSLVPAGCVPDQIVDYNGTPQIGKYNYLGCWNSFDHLDIIGLPFLFRSVTNYYRNHAVLLGSLSN